MKEKDFQIKFGHWVKENMKESAAFELKSVKGSSCPFNAVQDHQIAALMQATRETLYHKIPDVGFQNPFDCFCLYRVNAYVVIRYGSGRWYGILVDVFEWERGKSERKSLTEERARKLSTFSG